MDKKVIIFGINSKFLLEAMSKLDEKFHIIGFSDYKFDHAIKTFCYKPFYYPKELEKIEYDYIIILAKTVEDNKLKYNTCLQIGARKEQIIQYYYWGGVSKYAWQFNHVANMKYQSVKFEGYVLGMSYSYLGLFSHLLQMPVYKLSLLSSDLHYSLKVCQKVLNEEYTDRSKLKFIMIDVPYYIFNYDYSKNRYSFRRALPFWKDFEDYHHLSEIEPIEMKLYDTVLEMFGRAEYKRRDFVFMDDITIARQVGEQDIEKIKSGISHVWRKMHTETIKENELLFRALIATIRAYNPEIKIVVTVFPQTKYMSEFWPDEVERMKTMFYDIVGDYEKRGELIIWDYYKHYFEQDTFFADYEHLNKHGATAFSKEINNRLLAENIWVEKEI